MMGQEVWSVTAICYRFPTIWLSVCLVSDLFAEYLP